MKTRMKSLVGLTAAVALALAVSQNAMADEVVKESPMATFARNLNPANWKMPNFRTLLPGQDEKARITKKKDGLVSEVSQTASNSWNKTKQMFSPERMNPARMFTASARTPSTKEKSDKPGFFRSLFAPPEPEPSSTVTEFLRQSRPSP